MKCNRLLVALRLHHLLIVLLLVSVGGCSSSTGEIDRYAISGEVTFKGEPVANGTITLEPDADKGNKGPASTAEIKDGKFSIPSARGIVGGAYIARLTGYGEMIEISAVDTTPGDPLFSDYEMHVELPAEESTHSFDVTLEKGE